IHVRVLLSRIKAMLKRFDSTVRDADGQSCGVVIDRERYLVFCEGRQLTLPRKEFELLSLLCSKPQKVFSREEIFASVWGSDVIVGDRTIDVHVRKLREKLGDRHIVTVKGVGYKFED
ncbi:MAG: response regulator transcription factor, partial [Alistipes ihumii]|nr:response regulator transcription factor [Alistipes ihumii]